MATSTTDDRQPGDAEYLGALCEISEQRGRSFAQAEYRRQPDGRVIPTYAVGDYVSWNEADGSVKVGHIIEVLDEDANIYHIAAHVPGKGRLHYAVDGEQIRPF